MDIRLLDASQAHLLEPGLKSLAAVHNSIPSYFSGIYPFLPISSVLGDISVKLREDRAAAEAVFEIDPESHKEELAGFCQISFEHNYGSLDYLFVHEKWRGRGYGGLLLGRAVAELQRRGATLVDLKVVDGNKAGKLYERFGFRARSTVMSLKLPGGN